MNDTSTKVLQLFDRKAESWKEKYCSGAALERRLIIFGELVQQRCAENARVLDFGCGTGDLARHLCSLGFRSAGCDISPKMLEIAQAADHSERIDWFLLTQDWYRLPFESSSFDALVASSVFEYLADPALALRESERVLKPGGVLLFTAPDTRSPIRRIERLLRPIAILLGRIRALRLFPKIEQYASYLQLSKNRLRAHEWQSLAAASSLMLNRSALSPRQTLALFICTKQPSFDHK